MAKAAFDPSKHLQVFRGSRQPLGVYAKHAGDGCCGNGYSVSLDRLADVVHGPNVYSHLKPTTFNEKFMVPMGPVGGSIDNDVGLITKHINAVGVGAKIGLIVIPNYAYITDVSLHIFAEEPGLTFDLTTRNGLALPSKLVNVITSTRDDASPCEMARTVTTMSSSVTGSVTGTANTTTGEVTGTVAGAVTPATGAAAAFQGFGALNGAAMIDIFARDADGVFTADPDELMLVVKSMPTDGKVLGKFRITVAVNYSICDRAERE